MANPATNDVIEYWHVIQGYTFSGLEENIGDVVPGISGARYWCTDSKKMIMSSNGTDWDLLQFTAVAYP